MLTLNIIHGQFAVCQLKSWPTPTLKEEFFFVSKTDREISVVCEVDHMPADVISCDKPWRAMRVEGVLDFSLVGVLAGIANTLAVEGISIFAISTYDTDYILVKSDSLDSSVIALRSAGYEVIVID